MLQLPIQKSINCPLTKQPINPKNCSQIKCEFFKSANRDFVNCDYKRTEPLVEVLPSVVTPMQWNRQIRMDMRTTFRSFTLFFYTARHIYDELKYLPNEGFQKIRKKLYKGVFGN